ncbi:hypothetical protein RUND412_005461 [Rhizina undulata]
MQGKKNETSHPIAVQRQFRNPRSNQSLQSSSLPSTPNHHARQVNGVSRSPSPSSYLLDSPRSAASEPVNASPHPKINTGGCKYETALINARRRMPYSLGIEKLGKEMPTKEKLLPTQAEKLTDDMLVLFEKLKPSEESNERRRKFLEKLATLLNREWPGHNIKVRAFGSTENHLCMTDSDVDVCITTEWKELEHTCMLSKALAKHGMERVVCVPGAKVPIVKIWDPEFKVACDMNVNNTLALDNTRMIKTYVEIDDRVRPLAMIIKHWTRQRVLNDAAGGGTLSSYTWICMILNFLQTRDPPILPALHQRPHKKKPPIAGVDISFDDDVETLRGFGKQNKETIGELLFEFFKTFGHDMDYEKKVISVRQGKLLSKDEKKWQYLQNNRLCVEEPFNTSRNLGNTADDSSVRGLHLEFRRAHKILAEQGDLAACCEQYEFPPEEHHPIPHQHHPPRPVTLSRSSSNHGRQRGNYSGNGRGRGLGWNNRTHHQNRRNINNNNSGYTNPPFPHPYYSPELFGYVHTQQEHLFALQAQIQAVHAHAAQLAQAAQLQSQAHAHAQIQGQQSQSQSIPQQANSSTPSLNSAVNSHDLSSLHPLAQYAYYAQLYGMHVFYPTQLHTEAVTAPVSPPRTPGMNDNRHGLGRGRRQGVYNPGMRSQSQPPPIPDIYSIVPGYGSGITAVHGSEDDDFADHSSNGNPPETPPEDEPDEYVGFYSIGGSLQQDLAVVDQEGEEETFLEQKTIVDRQKRLSQEALPPPLLKSRESSPLSLDQQSNLVRDLSPTLSLERPVPENYHGDRGPVIVNGSIPTKPSTSCSDAYAVSPPSESIFPYDISSRTEIIGVDGTVDVMKGSALSEHPQLYAQRLLEVHNQAAGVGLQNGASNATSPTLSQYSSPIGPMATSPSAVPISPLTGMPLYQFPLDDDQESILSSQLSPNRRQRASTQQLLWSNSRAPAPDALKGKWYGSSQEDLVLALTPVPEVPSPSPSTGKKDFESFSQSQLPKSAWENSSKVEPKEESGNHIPVVVSHAKKSKAPTSVPKTNGSSADGKIETGGNSDVRPEQKPTWKKPPNRGTRKKKKTTGNGDSSAPANEAERKGG